MSQILCYSCDGPKHIIFVVTWFSSMDDARTLSSQMANILYSFVIIYIQPMEGEGLWRSQTCFLKVLASKSTPLFSHSFGRIQYMITSNWKRTWKMQSKVQEDNWIVGEKYSSQGHCDIKRVPALEVLQG